MKKLNEILVMWEKDSVVNSTEIGVELLNIPKLHSKYLNILSHYRLLIKEIDIKYNKLLMLKYEYYQGLLDPAELKARGWVPLGQKLMKTEIPRYLEADDDLIKLALQKKLYQEVVDTCESIMKEINNRGFHLRSYLQWEQFIAGVN